VSRLWIILVALGILVATSFLTTAIFLSQSAIHEQDSQTRMMPTIHDYISPATMHRASLKSSVDYTSCCGLGHRMSKMVDAYFISRVRNFGLRVFWGFCDETTEIFHHFFGAQPLAELESVNSTRWSLKINNESPCFSRFKRTGNDTECHCPQKYIEASGLFYTSLAQRFRKQSEVEEFKRRHDFANHLVIGLHVRAGNGEQGDFVKKNRNLQNASEWVHSVSNFILTLSKENLSTQSPLLFIATDTASIVSNFRESLKGKIPVVDYEQERLDSGSGVALGEMGAGIKLNSEECLVHWKNPLMDMIILASADIVVAGRPSSFTQSLPMGVALARSADQRKTQHTYCEVSVDGRAVHCYQDFHDWCCHGTTQFHLSGIRGYEFRRMPRVNFETECKTDDFLVKRPPQWTEQIATIRKNQAKFSFLPYDWDWVYSQRKKQLLRNTANN
jgi:hypothetical protein